jgi:transcription termination factor NusB
MAQVDRNIDRVDFVEKAVIYLQLCFYQFLVPHKVFITEFVNDELKQVLC